MGSNNDEPGRSSYPLKAIEALFAGALERPLGAPRQSWLHHAAGGDEALLAEVNELLAAHDTSAGFLEKGALLGSSDPLVPANEALIDAQIGTQLGPYELVELLGEGGFGTVFRAKQTEPVRREVALKVIKLGMDTRQVIARFEAERQALAVLDHPCIARVLDAGATENGRPYFVMDLASGVDLTKFCDGERLTVRQRCDVFIDLCFAMQHAHQRGIIHRDLKPSNVLASRQEGRIVPKVIDFGIAKATGEDLAEASMFTELGQVIGTPVYMSPEQATGSADIDTRADVYSLGVILYELLTGVTPLSTDDLRASSADLAVFLRDFEATPPSQRLSGLGPELVTTARARGSNPADLRSQVRGDLDHIVLCALEGNRDERYESAASLARDVQRALENRPIEARPPSSLRRTGKFIRRHQVAVAAGAIVLGTTLFGAAFSIGQLKDKENQGRVLQSVFLATSNNRAVDGFEDTVEGIENQIADAYSTNAPIMVNALSALADNLARRGAIQGALDARHRALQAAQRIHGENAEETDLARASLGLELARAGRRVEAGAALAAAVRADSERSEPGTPMFNNARVELAQLLLDDDQLDRAEEVATTAATIAQTAGSDDHRLRTEALEALVQVCMRRGEEDRAQATWESLLEAYDLAHSAQSLVPSRHRVEYSRWLYSVGKFADAARLSDGVVRHLGAVPDVPAELELDAVRSLNRAALEAPYSIGGAKVKASLRRERKLTRSVYGRRSRAYGDALRHIADSFKRLGDPGAALEIRCIQFRLLQDQLGAAPTDFRLTLVLTALADELGSQAEFVCRRDDLDDAAYHAAMDAVGLALELNPKDAVLLETEMILTVRIGDYMDFFQRNQHFRNVTGMSGEHPLNLALMAIGFSMQRQKIKEADTLLQRAREMAKKPEFVAVPRLHETLDWAEDVIDRATEAFGEEARR